MKLLKWLAIAGLAAGCSNSTTTDADAGVDASISMPDLGNVVVDRGRYLVNNLGTCTFCHTPLNPDGTRDLTRLMAGWNCFVDTDPTDDKVGCLSSANLTNDDSGLKKWTDAQIKDALLNGIDDEKKPLAPVMPYWLFHNLTSDDADAIVAYLRTLPPVQNTVTEKQAPWSLIPAPSVVIDPATIPLPPMNFPARDSALRGRYLAAEAGLCLDCHTPEDANPMAPRPIDMTKPFVGGRMFTAEQLGLPVPPYPQMIYTANLTSDATGLGGWTLQEIINAYKNGTDRQGKAVCAATHGSMISPYAGLSADDATDIGNYILSLPPVVNMRPMDCQGPTN